MSGMDRKTLRAPEITLKCLIIKLLKALKKSRSFREKVNMGDVKKKNF